MGATFSVYKTFLTGEVLTAADLNSSFSTFITNLTPAGLDDESTNDAAAQATSDPYPADALSKATSLQGEIQQIRFQLDQIIGKTYWYEDPTTSLYSLFSSGTKMWFYQNAAPTGWTIDSTPADALLAVKGGSQAYNANGGTQGGTWTQPNHTHTYTDVINHTHQWSVYAPYATSGNYDQGGGNEAGNTGTFTTTNPTGGTATGTTSNGATAITWRPLAQIGIICTKD